MFEKKKVQPSWVDIKTRLMEMQSVSDNFGYGVGENMNALPAAYGFDGD